MALPHSMDYLMNNGVLDFDAAAYLNNPMAGGVNYAPNMLGGVQMQAQPKSDSFSNKAKAKLKDIDFLKKAATAVISAVLIGTALVKGKKCWNNVKSSQAVQSVGNFFTSAKSGISNFISKFKK